MDDELDRLGLPLRVALLSGAREHVVHVVAPIGPARVRSFALPLDLAAEGDTVSVRLDSTPRFWDLDQIALAPDPGGEPPSQLLEPRAATLVSASGQREDVLARITSIDQRRVAILPTAYVDLRFAAPLANLVVDGTSC